jgi:hypothetical protein
VQCWGLRRLEGVIGSVLAGQVVEDFAGLVELGELFFFGAEFGRVGNKRAAGAPGGMLDVEHLVIEDVFHGALRDVRAVHAAIEQYVTRSWVVAAELAAPTSDAPANVRSN